MEKEKKLYKPLPDYLAIGPSDIHGAGIFAQDDIPKDIEIGISHIYDPNFQNDHSENPNCELVEDDDDTDYRKLKTIEKIEAGKELTLEYSLYNFTSTTSTS